MKNKILKLISGLTLTVVLCGIFVGCSSKPKGDPTEVLNTYTEAIKDNNIENSYELLSEVSKSNCDKEDYLKLYEYNSQIMPIKDFKISKGTEYTNKVVDGTKYNNIVSYNISETLHDVYNDKDINNVYEIYVVNDNDSWKVYKKEDNLKRKIAEAMTKVAQLYLTGEGRSKDLNKAESILREAIKTDADYGDIYFVLGVTLEESDKYDESINTIQEALDKIDNDKMKSDAYNILGIDYQHKKDKDKAKEAYSQAVQLNADNKAAKSNLEGINKPVSDSEER